MTFNRSPLVFLVQQNQYLTARSFPRIASSFRTLRFNQRLGGDRHQHWLNVLCPSPPQRELEAIPESIARLAFAPEGLNEEYRQEWLGIYQ